MKNGPIFYTSDQGWTEIIVSNGDELCGYFGAFECLAPNERAPSVREEDLGTNRFVLSLGGAATGEYSVTSNPALGACERTRVAGSGSALVYFRGRSVCHWAVSGTVWLSSLSTQDAKGRYSLMMDTGALLEGSFSASVCPVLGAVDGILAPIAIGQLCVNSSDADGGVLTTCSCEGRSSQASCALISPSYPRGGYACSCVSASGVLSTCTHGIAPDRNCCPLSLTPDGGV